MSNSIKFEMTMDPDSLDVIINGIRQVSIQRHHDRPPRLVIHLGQPIGLWELQLIMRKFDDFVPSGSHPYRP